MKLVELFGLPKTGKTTTANAVLKHLKARGVRAELVHERASRCPIRNKLHPRFNLWTTVSLLKAVLEAEDRGVDVLLADRGVLDAAVWVESFCDKGQFDEDRASFEQLASVGFLVEVLEVGYFFSADLNVVLHRYTERHVEKKRGTIVNASTLSNYRDAYRRMASPWSVPIVELDTTFLSLPDILARVIPDIEHRLLERDPAKRGVG